jgi:phosphomannomutase
MNKVTPYLKKEARHINMLDGISMQMKGWHFNLRASNTNNILRLNVESRNNTVLLQHKTAEIKTLLENFKCNFTLNPVS